MSKIPQGEWDAIAARYAQGESISRIAQSYACTPPAIHYILKRNRHRTTRNPEEKLNGMPDSPGLIAERRVSPDPRHLSQLRSERGPAPAALNEIRATSALPAELRSVRDRENTLGGPTYQGRDQPKLPQPPPGSARNLGQASAATAGLDSDLQCRAEAAIEAFRSSFDAALAEASPVRRLKLRQAASDLMRVAARTTIVLDRLNARAEHASVRAEDYSPSWDAR
jgi:hypothetical protein